MRKSWLVEGLVAARASEADPKIVALRNAWGECDGEADLSLDFSDSLKWDGCPPHGWRWRDWSHYYTNPDYSHWRFLTKEQRDRAYELCLWTNHVYIGERK